MAEGIIRDKSLQCGTERTRIVGRHEQAIVFVLNHLGHVAHPAADHRHSVLHGLQIDEPKTLVE